MTPVLSALDLRGLVLGLRPIEVQVLLQGDVVEARRGSELATGLVAEGKVLVGFILGT